MGDLQLVRLQFGQAKTLAGFAAQDVLHRDGFAGAQQGAVKNRVGARVRLGIAAGGHVKAPRLNAAVPVAPGERHVFSTLINSPCAHKIGIAAVA